MKIRATPELNDALDNALAWRKKEISNFHLLIQECRRNHHKEVLRRAAIMVYYAHWEGFTKQAATYYLELVSRQKLLYCDLNTNFVALSCRDAIKEAANSNKTYLHSQLIDFILFNQHDRSRISYKGVIDTESNLNSKVLQNLLCTIGLDFDDYWIKKSLLIDGSLLKLRNEITHGEKTDVTEEAYLEIHKLVVDLLDTIKNYIENAAIRKTYKR